MSFMPVDARDPRGGEPGRYQSVTRAFRSLYPTAGEKPSSVISKMVELKSNALAYRAGLFRGYGLDDKLASDWDFYKGYDTEQGEIKDIRFSTRSVFRQVRTLQAELMRGEPLPRVEVDRLSDGRRQELINRILRDQSRMARSLSPLTVFTFEKCLHGQGLMRLDWCVKTRMERRRKVMPSVNGLPPAVVEMDSEETYFKGPVLRNIEMFNFMWDPDGIDLDSCGWVMERDPAFTASDVLDYLDGGVFQIDRKTRQELESQLGGGGMTTGAQATDKRRHYNTSEPTDRIQPVFALDRYYTDDHVFYVLNDTWLMNQDEEFQENPFVMRHAHRKPYIYSRLYDTGEFLGEGLAEITGPSQYWASTAVKLEFKQLYSNLRRKLLIEKGSVEDMTKVYSEVDDAVVVNDINGVRPLDPLRTTGAALDFADRIDRRAESESGITRLMQGMTTPGNTTATESAEIADQIDKQTASMIRNQVQAARDWMTMVCEYNYLFLDMLNYSWDGRPVKITNELFDTADLTVDVIPESFIANISSLQQKRMEIFAQAVATRPYINWLTIDYARAKAAGLDPAEVITQPVPPSGSGLGSPLNDQVTQQNQALATRGPGAPPAPGQTNGPSMQPGNPPKSLQALNPLGVQGMGQPNSELGETAREAVLA